VPGSSGSFRVGVEWKQRHFIKYLSQTRSGMLTAVPVNFEESSQWTWEVEKWTQQLWEGFCQ
jgi:hypothetical protein